MVAAEDFASNDPFIALMDDRVDMRPGDALGAAHPDVLRLVLVEGVTTAIAGVALGVASALALGRVMASLLIEVTPRDPLTFGASAGLLLFVAILASYVPARRAARVEPVTALRAE